MASCACPAGWRLSDAHPYAVQPTAHIPEAILSPCPWSIKFSKRTTAKETASIPYNMLSGINVYVYFLCSWNHLDGLRLLHNALAFFHEKAETRVSQQWLETRAEPHSAPVLDIIPRTSDKLLQMTRGLVSGMFLLTQRRILNKLTQRTKLLRIWVLFS